MQMVLGLGSNQGDRLSYLRRAIHLLHSIAPSSFQILNLSPIYESKALLPAGASPSWDQPFFNINVLCECLLPPEKLLPLIKGIEKKLGRKAGERWAPREMDIDILTAGALYLKTPPLEIPHPGLTERPFALLPLIDLLPDWVCPVPGPNLGKTARAIGDSLKWNVQGTLPFETCRSLLCFTETVGILNLTPDSFSDGGCWNQPDQAIEKAYTLVSQGVSILDIGAESTRPQAERNPITPKEEWRRLEPVLKSLSALFSNWPTPVTLSIDTRNAEVAEKALNAGADWINDVSGFEAIRMQEVVKNSDAQLVMMHSLGVPPERHRILSPEKDPISTLLDWAEQRLRQLETKGILRDRIIFDPGIGFGKSVEQTWAILRGIHRFRSLGVKTLIGHSRKSFFSQLFPSTPTDRDLETVTVSLDLAQKGVDYLRIHQTEMHRRAFQVWTQTNGVCRWTP